MSCVCVAARAVTVRSTGIKHDACVARAGRSSKQVWYDSNTCDLWQVCASVRPWEGISPGQKIAAFDRHCYVQSGTFSDGFICSGQIPVKLALELYYHHQVKHLQCPRHKNLSCAQASTRAGDVHNQFEPMFPMAAPSPHVHPSGCAPARSYMSETCAGSYMSETCARTHTNPQSLRRKHTWSLASHRTNQEVGLLAGVGVDLRERPAVRLGELVNDCEALVALTRVNTAFGIRVALPRQSSVWSI